MSQAVADILCMLWALVAILLVIGAIVALARPVKPWARCIMRASLTAAGLFAATFIIAVLSLP